ncbi:MAG: pilus assembly protein, partial [Chloroflexi bacterium]|nr:pilus assembly protein [Chloroflexota bacterium]
MEINIFKKFNQKNKAQGIVEFALVLPLLLILVFGIIEAGRLLFIYSAVLSSSREAARYGSAAGEITGYIPYYGDCDGIRAAAMRIGRFAGVSATDVSISYDHGPTSSTNFAICPLGGNEYINLGDRITVQVVATFQPLLPLVNFQPIPISAITRRTIIKDVAIEGTPPSPVTPTIAFVTGEQTVDEGVGKITVMLQLTAAIDKTVTVPYTLDGTAINTVDYTVSPNPVVLLPGDTIGEIQITIIDDDIDEEDETAVLIMGNPTNAIKGTPFAHIATIVDNDDPPVVSFVLADQSHPESIDGLAMLLLSNPSSRDITVNYSVGGDAQGGYDYSLTASPITIPALDLTFPIVIDVTDDLIDEVDETIILSLGDIVNATKGSPDVHLYTIEDDDDPPDVFFTWENQSGDETVGTMTVEYQL